MIYSYAMTGEFDMPYGSYPSWNLIRVSTSVQANVVAAVGAQGERVDKLRIKWLIEDWEEYRRPKTGVQMAATTT